MALILLIWPSTGLVVQEVVIAARTASMSRAMPLAKLLSSLLPASAIHSSSPAMSLPLRRDTNRFARSAAVASSGACAKQMAEEQPGFSVDLIRILAQIPSTATTRGSFPGQMWLCCSSRVCMCTPVSGPSRHGYTTSSITLLLKLPPKLLAHVAAGGPPRFAAMPRRAREDVKVCEDANAPVRRQRPASAEQCACRRRAVGRSWMSGNPARAGGRFHPSVRVAQPFDLPATVQGRAAARKCWSSLVARTP